MHDADEPTVELRGEGDSIEDVWVAGYPFGKILESVKRQTDAIDQAGDRIADLEARVQQLEQDVATRATADGGETMSKKAVAKQVSMQEAVRRAEKGLAGGMVDWPTVRDIADRQYHTDLNSTTVYDAWTDLTSDWTAFNEERGQPGPHGSNRRLTVEKEAITPSLRRACEQQG